MDAAQKQRLETLLQKGDLAGADQQVANALRANPNDADALVFRARLTAFKGEVDAALFVIDRALKVAPQHSEGRATKAALLLEKGRVAEGKALLAALVKERDAPAMAHFNLGRCLHDEDDLDGALRSLEKALALEPDNGITRFHLAAVCADRGEHERALTLLEETLRADPGFGDAWLELARVQIGLGHEGDAMRNLEEAVRHCPSHAGVRELFGTTLLLAGEVENATAQFEELVKLAPKEPSALSSLGLCFAAQGRLAESEEAYRKALKLSPDDAHVKTQLASLLELKEERPALEEAVRLLKEVVRSPDAGWEPFFELGRILTTRNEVLDLARGIDMLERAQKRSEGAPEPALQLARAYARVGAEAPMRELCRALVEHPAANDETRAEARRLLGEKA